MRSHLLGPFERRVKRPSPAHRHVRIGFFRTPIFIMQQLQRFRQSENPVVRRQRIVGAFQGAFGTGPVVTTDVDDDRVVEFALVLNLLDDAANFIIGIGGVGGENLSLADVEFLLDRRERIPTRQLGPAKRGLTIRPWGKLGIRWNHAKFLLVGEDCVA